MENNATLPSPDSSVLLEITPEVTQSDDHVADEDANDDEDQVLWVMSKILLQLKEPEEIHVSPFGSIQI